MSKEILTQKIEQLKKVNKVNDLIEFMMNKGFETDKWFGAKRMTKAVESALEDFFSKNEIAISSALKKDEQELDFKKMADSKRLSKSKKYSGQEDSKEETEIKNEKKEGEDNMENAVKNEELLNGEGIKDNEGQHNEGELNNTNNTNDGANKDDVKDKGTNKKDEGKNDEGDKKDDSPKPKTKSQIQKEYKTVHNLVYLSSAKETEIENVRLAGDTGEDLIYTCEMNGEQLADFWLDGTFTFDPTMQRGVKETTKGDIIASFKDTHIREIAESMMNSTFTPTQIHLGIITDDEDIRWHYDEETGKMTVVGKVRLIDGQHRTRALAKILNEMKTQKDGMENADIERYVFNVQIHVCNSEHARIIYSNINKNLKLDKSQVRQLSGDHYARIINALNQHSESPLKGKIATSKPVNNKLVLFSNLADALEKSIDIGSKIYREEVINYLMNFFDYVAYKLEDGFGADDKKRAEFRANNLLNENNTFLGWIKVAFLDKGDSIKTEKYKESIDKIVAQVDFFKKDNDYWLKNSSVKHKIKGEGFAMNNTTSGINAIRDKMLEIVTK